VTSDDQNQCPIPSGPAASPGPQSAGPEPADQGGIADRIY
jgi:hypothetical protein